MFIHSWQGHEPQLAPDVWIAPDAKVIGQVSIATGSSIWFGCVVRGDVEPISIGSNTNVQDLSLLHVTGGKFPLEIGSHCTLGHRATLHGCVLRDYAFVGIGATVLDGCELGEFALLAAGSLLPPGKKIPPFSLAMGIPAKVVRKITSEEEQMIKRSAQRYSQLKENYRKQF